MQFGSIFARLFFVYKKLLKGSQRLKRKGLHMDIKLYNKLKRNIVLDYINTFITNLNMQSSVWVLYLAYCGLSIAETGIVEGIYHATSIIFEIPSGAIADLLGRKRSMVLGRVCIAISCIIMLFSRSFWYFALGFAIQALGNNFNSGSEEALIYDSLKYIGKEHEYMRIFGRRNVIIEVSQGIATVAGAVLAEYSYFWCYSACLIIALLAAIQVLFITEAPVVENMEGKHKPGWKHMGIMETIRQHFKTSYNIIRSDIRILKIIIYYSVVFASQTLLFFYSQQYYKDLGYNKIQIGFILLLAGTGSCIGALFSNRLYKKYGRKIIAAASLLIAFAFVGYGFNNIILSVVLLMAASFSDSLLYPVQSDELNRLIPSGQRATLVSVDSLFFSIAMIIMFPAAGALADIRGMDTVFSSIGIGLIVFVVVILLLNKPEDI
ncbi:MAG: MFS transporter [Lachnospiraceae bacterium]|nr:MFS transporter [Lachnospiraceae bacterium]